MKITDKIISIPPYISTTWDKVALVRMRNDELVITLRDGSIVTVPHLPADVIQQIFSAHLASLEQQVIQKPPAPAKPAANNIEQILGAPMKIVFGTLDSLSQVLQHNPAHKDMAPIPPELVEKITMLTQAIPPEDIAQMPDPEPECNCMHCQIVRVLKEAGSKPIEELVQEEHAATEEEVADEELRFEEWEVAPVGEKLYLVTNKLDRNEHYNVFLGEPLGCTCGKAHCEHIIAVLRH
jgi:hypothetical protein